MFLPFAKRYYVVAFQILDRMPRCFLHYIPFLFNFPPILLNSPYIFKLFICSYTKVSSTYQNVIFPPPKSTKPFVSLLKLQISTKMGMKKISEDFCFINSA